MPYWLVLVWPGFGVPSEGDAQITDPSLTWDILWILPILSCWALHVILFSYVYNRLCSWPLKTPLSFCLDEVYLTSSFCWCVTSFKATEAWLPSVVLTLAQALSPQSAPASLFIGCKDQQWTLCLLSFRGYMSCPPKSSPSVPPRILLGPRSPLVWLGVERKTLLPVPTARLINPLQTHQSPTPSYM